MIVGTQCQIWTEYMEGPEQVGYMLLPRLSAFAERAWGSPEDVVRRVPHPAPPAPGPHRGHRRQLPPARLTRPHPTSDSCCFSC